MKRILVHFAHPARSRSTMNKALLSSINDLEGVTVNDLYARYPDFLIDVRKEQALCEEHDVIVFQHPFYWYSTPSIIKEWLDLVLEHGWAFGSEGKALHGKIFLQALTAGGDDSTYRQGGYNEFTIRELTSPTQATAKLCGMTWLPPFAVTGVHQGLAEAEVQRYVDQYRRCITELRDDSIDLEEVKIAPYLNSKLD
ncbi:MAG: NAD(P)H-dependent oxidoreductase [Akkermansiaceae bacterium]